MAHKTGSKTKHTWVDKAIEAATMTESQLAAKYPRVGRKGYNIPTSHGWLLWRIGNAVLELPENDRATMLRVQGILYLGKLRKFVAVDGRPTTVQERKTSVRMYAATFGATKP